MKKKITDKTYVKVISNRIGGLFYKSARFNSTYEWADYGHEIEMTIEELKDMKYQEPKFFNENWIRFLEEDKDVIAHLGLESRYSNLFTWAEAETLLTKDDNQISSAIEKLGRNEKAILFKVAKEKYNEKQLNNTFVLRALEEKLNVDFALATA